MILRGKFYYFHYSRSSTMSVIRNPFVYWAQSEKSIFLRIDIKNVVKPDFEVLEDNVKFTAEGIGAHGLGKYKFSLDLYAPLKINSTNGEKPATVSVSERQIDVVLQKQTPTWWPRLTALPEIPVWLKVNFDLWVPANGHIDKEDDGSTPTDKQKKKERGARNEVAIKAYMTFYNLCQLSGYMYCLSAIARHLLNFGINETSVMHDQVGHVIKYLQLLQLMETVHPLLGLTRGGAFMPFFQIIGRLVMTFCHLGTEPRLRNEPILFLLFVTWSLVESVRCSYYITQMYDIEVPILKWLRYSMWIVLYPIGITSEVYIMYQRIPYLKERDDLAIAMPNSWNFAFNVADFLEFHAWCTLSSAVVLMGHMYNQRKQRLNPKNDKNKVM